MSAAEFNRTLGSRLSDLRKQYGWTQQQLAEKLNMTQHNVSRYENGEYGLSVYQLAVLSDIFAITTDSWFVGDDKWQNFVRQL